jgi:predicted amidohydrolase
LPFRIALANLPPPVSRDESVELAAAAIREAAAADARLIAFPECFVPGYRMPGSAALPPDHAFLERAWATLAKACAESHVACVLGTERVEGGELRATALVIDADGATMGFQDKVQIDPSEEGIYAPGAGRRLFTSGPLTFGVVICHEGFRYPETVRWAARRGARLVVHIHFMNGTRTPSTFADPAGTFHEKAVLCRAAENTCFFATVNMASEGSPTTSAIASPDGTLLCHQPHGRPGLLIGDLDLALATGLLALRCKY